MSAVLSLPNHFPFQSGGNQEPMPGIMLISRRFLPGTNSGRHDGRGETSNHASLVGSNYFKDPNWKKI